MANKTKATPEEEEAREQGPEIPDAPLPLLDLSDAAIKQATKRGYVTYEQLNAIMPSEEVTAQQIEEALATLDERGINVVETEEAEADEEEETREKRESEETESSELVEVTPKTPAKSEAKEPIERSDDPVRMYLREMGSIGLLSRQGEIAIAKRIEAGREVMIAGLCESPLTFQAVTIWRNELNNDNVFLHDIIDLEATYSGPDAKAVPAAVPGGDASSTAPASAPPSLRVVPPQPVAPPSAPPAPTPFKRKPLNVGDSEQQPEEGTLRESDPDEDDPANSMSLVAIEAELKPTVLETFDARYLQTPAPTAGPGHRRQAAQRVAVAGAGAQVQEAQERDHRRDEVAAAQSGAHRRPGRAALRH
jgi:RNA polymerase primary sigma factor